MNDDYTSLLVGDKVVLQVMVEKRSLFFSLTPFCRDKVTRSCFTGQLPGIRTVFILASLQMCKVQKVKSKHKVH